jgi:hypothetical protein
MAEVLGRFAPHALIAPVLSLGSGALSVSAAGEADPPFTTRSQTTWSALSGLGAGFVLQPSANLSWIAEAQLLANWSKTAVAIEDHTVATVGRPMAFLSTSLAGVY